MFEPGHVRACSSYTTSEPRRYFRQASENISMSCELRGVARPMAHAYLPKRHWINAPGQSIAAPEVDLLAYGHGLAGVKDGRMMPIN
jgi:hypothetical protein